MTKNKLTDAEMLKYITEAEKQLSINLKKLELLFSEFNEVAPNKNLDSPFVISEPVDFGVHFEDVKKSIMDKFKTNLKNTPYRNLFD